MDEIEERLRAWGARWQASQHLEDPRRIEPSKTRTLVDAFRFAGFLVVVGIAVVGLVSARAALVPGLPAPSGNVASRHFDANTVVVRPGDAVSASGDLVVDTGGAMHLCLPPGGRLVFPPDKGCSAISVLVHGITRDQVPSWDVATNGDEIASGVIVFGTWTGALLDGRNVSQTSAAPQAAPPCSVVSSTPTAPSGLDSENSRRALADEMAAHPDRYGGLWSAVLGSTETPVVGVVGDTVTASQEAALLNIYPYPLCIVPVEFSLKELTDLSDKLNRLHPELVPTVDVPRNRVHVLSVILDSAAASEFAAYGPALYVESLVRVAE